MGQAHLVQAAPPLRAPLVWAHRKDNQKKQTKQTLPYFIAGVLREILSRKHLRFRTLSESFCCSIFPFSQPRLSEANEVLLWLLLHLTCSVWACFYGFPHNALWASVQYLVGRLYSLSSSADYREMLWDHKAALLSYWKRKPLTLEAFILIVICLIIKVIQVN